MPGPPGRTRHPCRPSEPGPVNLPAVTGAGARLRQAPGLIVALATGVALVLGLQGTPVPALLAALVAGMALRTAVQAHDSPAIVLQPGLEAAARPLLRTGVALMGFKIALSDLAGLGWTPVITAVVATAGTLGAGYAVARLVGLGRTAAILTASAVAICGAAAALAVGAVLARRDREGTGSTLVATVAAITVIGFACALAWPLMGAALGWSGTATAVFAGASIHEVAQVVAAGGLMVPADAAAATLVKMVRVALLPLVVVGLWIVESRSGAAEVTGAAPEAPVPLFLIGFAAAVALASTGWLPPAVLSALQTACGLVLAGAMVAIGTQTSARGLLDLGPRPLLALGLQTVLIAALAAGCLALAGLI